MDARAVEEFRCAQRRRGVQIWVVVVLAAAGGFFLVGVLWSYIAGLAEAVVLPLVAYELMEPGAGTAGSDGFRNCEIKRVTWDPAAPVRPREPGGPVE